MKPMKIGVREAKLNLSKLLRLVRQNQEIVITQHGRPVGKLVPIDFKSLPLEERLKRFQDMGLIQGPAFGTRKPMPAPIPVAGESAQKFLQEDRNDERR